MRSMNIAKKKKKVQVHGHEYLWEFMHVLWCFKTTTTTAWLILLAEPASCSSCVCVAAGVNYRKWFLLGVWRPLALVISIHANTFPSLCASRAACFCGARTYIHTHTHTIMLCMFCAHTWFLHSLFLIFFSVWLSLAPSPSASYVCVLVCLARVMMCVTGVGSYRGCQSHGHDTSLCVSNNLFVVRHKRTDAHTKKSTTLAISQVVKKL